MRREKIESQKLIKTEYTSALIHPALSEMCKSRGVSVLSFRHMDVFSQLYNVKTKLAFGYDENNNPLKPDLCDDWILLYLDDGGDIPTSIWGIDQDILRGYM